MLFHITHVHSPEACPALDVDLRRETIGEMLKDAKETEGFDVVAAYLDQPGHTMFMVVETDSVKKIHDVLWSTYSIAHADVTPVVDFKPRFDTPPDW